MKIPDGTSCRKCTPVSPCRKHQHLDPAFKANVKAHSPLPWVLNYYGSEDEWIRTTSGEPITHVGWNRNERDEDRRFIVRATKAFGPLVEVARLMLKVSCLCREAGMRKCGRACPKYEARAALKIAGEKP